MGAHAGAVYTDGRPIPSEMLDALAEENRVLGPHGTGKYVMPGVSLLSFALHFDRLAREERQPVQTSDGAVLVWDGRLDNREDFLCRLRHRLTDDTTDAVLMALALEAWHGTAALESAVGEWSLAYWHPGKRELWLARDYSGTRPLYYCAEAHRVVWSSCLEPLISVCERADDLNEAFVAGSLALGAPDYQTCYRGIFVLPPGHVLRVRPGQAPCVGSFVRFASAELRYKDPRDYEAHYLTILTEAVRVRLRARAAVWAELSGGYDSSSVVCLAHALARAGAVEAPRVQPVSVVSPESPESDESRYIEAVETWCELRSVRIPFTPAVRTMFVDEPATAARDVESPASLTQQAGSHVLLSGSFGDSITVPYRIQDILLDHLVAGRVRAFWHESVQYGRVSKTPLRDLWWPLLSLSWRTEPAVNERRRRIEFQMKLRHKNRGDLTGLFGIQEAFLRTTMVPLEPENRSRLQVSLAKRPFVRSLLKLGLRAARPRPVLTTTPFLHRPLVDFVLAVSPTVFWSHHGHRMFVCRALRDVLPDAVLRRRNKGDASQSCTRHLRPAVAAALAQVDQLLLVKRGYADAAALADILAKFLDGSQATEVHMTRILGTERLLREFEAERARARGTGGAPRVAQPEPSERDSCDTRRRPLVTHTQEI